MADQKGQTLVEMIVIIGMVVLLATGIVAGTTVSLSRSKTSQVRSDALTFAQAGIELARKQRDNGWDAFAAMGTSSNMYCVGSDGVFGQAQTECSVPNINNTFTRSVTLQLIPIPAIPTMEEMKVTSRVAWGDTTNPTNTNTVQLTTYLTQWK
jgi:type II secretory pathway pseudopilin PulG